jgi:predicted alpha/beta-fold hydrolase
LPDPFIPHPLLRNGHAQTLAGWALKPRITLPAAENRLFDVAPGVQVLCKCHFQQYSKTVTLLLLHGLEGSSDSNYVLGTASKAFAAGMNVIRMNIRNCGGTERLSRTLYHSGLSEDIGYVAAALAPDERVGKIAIAGFSLGGNQVLKLAGEWGRDFPPFITSVAAVSPAMDLDASVDLLHRPGNRLYEWQFLRSLKRRVMLKAKLNAEAAAFAELRRFRSMRDFDDRVTARAFGFAGARDYYARASASPLLGSIRVPALVIYAADDPFICVLPETRHLLQSNPHITVLQSKHGGHCGFIAAGGRRWAEEKIVEFVTTPTVSSRQ